ncbi:MULTISPECIES: iron-containing alcohol dehydrogenase [unclassified Clostridioides]|uniref:iron-containing alcohol dehydrogenase n=1 Tax=unclassified Clostridioides TaxID=2635829 RepID=UPI001D0C2120|nr:iron-containing alcohol dehydrogenase [Clostridioides sp. ES-S-0049-03]MCC0676321.1 iron-containing alcohol dehydrogenase [Clostridioides sp. ES-W-0018-02]MCC0711478.1 iron-containing alcohol dehydrogenase [Clostridioides sp. ES-W-0017-02]MCC0762780.1 iron-containing alcohol dehydrogenase [Clostridioides sp. ES-S-0006-03]
MINFYQPSRINFGQGTLSELPRIVEKYGKKCLLVTTPNVEPLDKLYERIRLGLIEKGIEVVHFDKVEPNPTVELIDKGFELAKKESVDVVLGVGGGSSIDTAKMLALTFGLEKIDWDYMFSTYTNAFKIYDKVSEKELPLIAVSTTSGTGSQVTQAAVISRGSEKNTIFHQNCFSRECIIDPELMLTLPERITVSTAFDAFTHAFESYINPNANDFTEIMSEKSMELVINYLPKVMKEKSNIEYRTKLAVADTLGGSSLANSGAAAPHPLSEIIGGVTHIPHGEALAIVFPEFAEKFYENNVAKFAKVARMFNEELKKVEDNEAAKALKNEIEGFLKRVGLKTKMSEFNVTKEQLEEIISCPVLGFLPFGKKEDLVEILEKSY